MAFRRQIQLAWLSVFFYALAIFFISSIQSKDLPEFYPHADKIFHFLEYFPFGFLVFRAIALGRGVSKASSLLVAVFVLMIYALSDEIHQIFVPGRDFSLIDMSFDLLGGFMGALAYKWSK